MFCFSNQWMATSKSGIKPITDHRSLNTNYPLSLLKDTFCVLVSERHLCFNLHVILTKSDLKSIDKVVSKRVKPLEKGQANLEKGQKKIQKNLKIVKKALILNTWDKKRVKRVESHLGIQPPEF